MLKIVDLNKDKKDVEDFSASFLHRSFYRRISWFIGIISQYACTRGEEYISK